MFNLNYSSTLCVKLKICWLLFLVKTYVSINVGHQVSAQSLLRIYLFREKNVISFISVSDSGDEENLPNVLDLENLAGGLCKILPR